MANTDLVISKGAFSVTIQDVEITDDYTNKLFYITPAQSKSNQADGSKPAKVVDLLKVTHTMVIKGFISHNGSTTSKEIKRNLVNIWKGAGTAGGVVTLTYDYLASAFGNTTATSASTIDGYIEKIIFTDKPMDQPSDYDSSPTNYPDVAKFQVAITFVEGSVI